jgi:hypothetical protein
MAGQHCHLSEKACLARESCSRRRPVLLDHPRSASRAWADVAHGVNFPTDRTEAQGGISADDPWEAGCPPSRRFGLDG